jgi:Yip1 domain
MNLINRVQSILLKPKATWPIIEAEPASVGSLYKNYVMILALIPAIGSFIGLSVIGYGGGFRAPIISGVVTMAMGYLLSLVMVFVQALITDALAPAFEATKNQASALKLSAYGSTASFIGGIFNLLPQLSFIGAVVGLYGIYLFYTGLPVLMKCPPKKTIPYTLAVVVCAIVGGVIVAWVLALLRPSLGA